MIYLSKEKGESTFSKRVIGGGHLCVARTDGHVTYHVTYHVTIEGVILFVLCSFGISGHKITEKKM